MSTSKAHMSLECTLCSLKCPHNPILDEEKPFCCGGCLTVYRILQTQAYCGDYQVHPLFKEALSSGIISNPHLQKETEIKQIAEETKTLHLEIKEMWCPSCADAIRLILMRHKGIKRCLVDYATDLAVIEYAPRILSKENLFRKIEKLGYVPHSLLEEERKPARCLRIRFAVSAFCAFNLMMLALPLYTTHFSEGYAHASGWLSSALALPLITYSAWPLWRRFFLGLRTGLFGMETLVLIAASTAFCTSTFYLFQNKPHQLYYDSMGMLLTFVLFGKILERRAKFSAKETLFRITRSLPKRGLKRQPGGEYLSTPIKQISRGDWILARTGEKIVLDGIVVEGEGLIDASVMTGESIPFRVRPGSRLVGGSIVKQGVLHIEVTKEANESVLSQITELIEHDLGHKRTARKVVDRFIPFFVPSVCFLALITFPFGGLLRSLSVLLISCPCAIGIAVPLAEARLLFRFAKEGALVRNRAALAIMAKEPLFVFDKTGTLTEGKFRVLSGLETLSELQKAILKAFTEHTIHPIGAALGESLISSVSLECVQEHIGRGMEGVYQNKRYLLGSTAFFQQRGIAVSAYKGTVVHFAEEDKVVASIHLGDQLRPDIPRIDGVILSGDSPELVAEIAKECGFRWGKGGCDPLQKRAEIEKLPSPIAMVGDGVNDAPALSAADVGISVVSATDLSIEVSDILLTKSSLSALPRLVLIAKKGQKIIYQNLFWAFIYNGIGLGLAMVGLLTPLFAVSAMLLSSLCVTINSSR